MQGTVHRYIHGIYILLLGHAFPASTVKLVDVIDNVIIEHRTTKSRCACVLQVMVVPAGLGLEGMMAVVDQMDSTTSGAAVPSPN